MEIKDLECKSCGANMEIDQKNHALVCPYCGAREIIVEDRPDLGRNRGEVSNTEKKKNGSLRKPLPAIIIIAVAFVILAAAAGVLMGNMEEVQRKHTSYDWPTTGLATLIPKPDAEYGEIFYDHTDSFSMDLYGTNMDFFRTYVSSCREKGFTVDEKYEDTSFRAYTEEGVRVEVSHYSYDDSMSIYVQEPLRAASIDWSGIDAFALLPAPASDQGEVQWEYSDNAAVRIANTTKTDFESYIKACKEAGFTKDSYKGADYYYADHETENWRLSLEFEGFDIMRVDASSFEPE